MTYTNSQWMNSSSVNSLELQMVWKLGEVKHKNIWLLHRLEYHASLTNCACEENLILWENVYEITLSG